MKLVGSRVISREKVNALIVRGLNYVHFSAELESIYRTQYKEEAAYEFRFRGLIILILYLFLSYGIYITIPDSDVVVQWLSLYAWVGIIILIAWIMSFIKRINQYFDLYTTLGSMLAVAISFVVIPIIGLQQENALLHAAMMYAVVIIYSFVGMRFYNAIIAGWCGGLIGYLVASRLNYDIDWTFLNRTYTFSSFLGMSIAYAIDRQHRENYLQNCIIELNKNELTEQALELERLSQVDALTGLANRRYLDYRLDQQWRFALRHQTPLSIMMVDIDYFKNYNDHFGHVTGDQCLQIIADHLKVVTSRSYELAARYGGEEFLLMFPEIDEHQIELIAEILIQQINEMALPHPSSLVAPHVTISIGCATIIPTAQDKLNTFIRKADEALYQAKLMGRNRYHNASATILKNIQVL
ncbi:diguanylate cyclase [Acinetobacter sp. NCu2D-2]|uniref:diguanylate cyclase n=1 Tax=Acinetobacter sp. NCu2D-2 TaxID=1608473 RepID=UPI0007CE02AD|nr:diguanylate cyclase [Acinetobacter sp. NCu2D-2]ANF81615.1 diguanylate cyclase [Acinetobacter sp. NCu2D-2]